MAQFFSPRALEKSHYDEIRQHLWIRRNPHEPRIARVSCRKGSLAIISRIERGYFYVYNIVALDRSTGKIIGASSWNTQSDAIRWLTDRLVLHDVAPQRGPDLVKVL